MHKNISVHRNISMHGKYSYAQKYFCAQKNLLIPKHKFPYRLLRDWEKIHRLSERLAALSIMGAWWCPLKPNSTIVQWYPMRALIGCPWGRETPVSCSNFSLKRISVSFWCKFISACKVKNSKPSLDEKSFRIKPKSDCINISRLIWNQTDVRLVPN